MTASDLDTLRAALAASQAREARPPASATPEQAQAIAFLRSLRTGRDEGATIYQDAIDAVLAALDAAQAREAEARGLLGECVRERDRLSTGLVRSIDAFLADATKGCPHGVGSRTLCAPCRYEDDKGGDR